MPVLSTEMVPPALLSGAAARRDHGGCTSSVIGMGGGLNTVKVIGMLNCQRVSVEAI
jgi:hypothetical protein